MKIIIVEDCKTCPIMKNGKPPYCSWYNLEIDNVNVIDKRCKLDEYLESTEDKPVESGKSLKEVLNPNKTTNEKPKDDTWDDDDADEWWGKSDEPEKKTDTTKNCTLCGNPFNGDEVTEMDTDNGVVNVHKTCFENIDALVESSEDVEIAKEKIKEEKKEETKSDDDWDDDDDGW